MLFDFDFIYICVCPHMLVSGCCLLHNHTRAVRHAFERCRCVNADTHIYDLYFVLSFWSVRLKGQRCAIRCRLCAVRYRTRAISSRSSLFHVCLFTIHSVSAWLYCSTDYTVPHHDSHLTTGYEKTYPVLQSVLTNSITKDECKRCRCR